MSPFPKQNQYSLKETCSQAILSEGFFLVLRIPPLFLYFFTWREATVLKIQQAWHFILFLSDQMFILSSRDTRP